MSEFLPREIRDEMERARLAARRRRSHMKVRAGDREFVILRYWDGGFAVDSDDAQNLRGLVDVYDRERHLCQALIVTSEEADGERVFEVKTETPAAKTAPAADFVRERPEPAGLLTRQ